MPPLRWLGADPYHRPLMQAARAEIARERRRMVQVREALVAGLETPAASRGRDPAEFYLACACYLQFSLGRLYRQDGLIHQLLSQRIGANDADAHAQLRTLSEEQRQGRIVLEEFSGAARDLQQSDGAGLHGFLAAARAFTSSFNASASARRNPFFQYTEELFGDADWERIAGVTPQSIVEEGRLFEAVRRTAPAGIDPEQFTAAHGPGQAPRSVQ